MATELQNLINDDDEPKYIILLEDELKPKTIKLLTELIRKLKRETGYGVIAMHMRDKSVQTITIEESFDAR